MPIIAVGAMMASKGARYCDTDGVLLRSRGDMILVARVSITIYKHVTSRLQHKLAGRAKHGGGKSWLKACLLSNKPSTDLSFLASSLEQSVGHAFCHCVLCNKSPLSCNRK
jgi:hypothetical protein